ncbi:MAG: hypothetical protein ACLR0P_13090 [Oscillospiraceae bacterium]
MVIQELKPSKRVRAAGWRSWRTAPCLRVGAGQEVLEFALCAGREMTWTAGGWSACRPLSASPAG